jgi:hypothetical protein
MIGTVGASYVGIFGVGETSGTVGPPPPPPPPMERSPPVSPPPPGAGVGLDGMETPPPPPPELGMDIPLDPPLDGFFLQYMKQQQHDSKKVKN